MNRTSEHMHVKERANQLRNKIKDFRMSSLPRLRKMFTFNKHQENRYKVNSI